MWRKVLRFLLWASPSLLVAGATWGLVAILTNVYDDSTHRWTAVATIFAGSALAVAVIGLSFAVYQLMQINRGLTRSRSASPRTPATELSSSLDAVGSSFRRATTRIRRDRPDRRPLLHGIRRGAVALPGHLGTTQLDSGIG
jgi:hypothetical protein